MNFFWTSGPSMERGDYVTRMMNKCTCRSRPNSIRNGSVKNVFPFVRFIVTFLPSHSPLLPLYSPNRRYTRGLTLSSRTHQLSIDNRHSAAVRSCRPIKYGLDPGPAATFVAVVVVVFRLLFFTHTFISPRLRLLFAYPPRGFSLSARVYVRLRVS